MKKYLKFISSHFLSLILIVVTLISISLMIFYNEYFKSKYLEEKEKLSFNNEVYQIAKKLISCLGEEKEKIFYINKEKLDDFSLKFNNIEPRCAIAEKFDYNVKIIQFEKEIRNYPPFEYKKSDGIAEEILKETDGKKVIFVLDVSGSMSMTDTPPCDGNKFKSLENSRICCLKKFSLYFLENYNSNTEIGINIFGVGNCDIKWVVHPYQNVSIRREEIKEKILKFYPDDSTPLLKGLLSAVENAEKNSYIILLTDGGENCGGIVYEEVVRKIKDKNISLISIGFGKGADINFLKTLSSKVNGKVYEAKNCEELVSERIEYEEKTIKIERKEWSFGVYTIGPKIFYEISISLPILIKYNETNIVEGILIINAYKGFLEEFYSFLDDVCNKEIENLEIVKKFYFDYNVKVYKDKICSENVCKKLYCKYEIEEKEFEKGENIILIKIENNKILIR